MIPGESGRRNVFGLSSSSAIRHGSDKFLLTLSFRILLLCLLFVSDDCMDCKAVLILPFFMIHWSFEGYMFDVLNKKYF